MKIHFLLNCMLVLLAWHSHSQSLTFRFSADNNNTYVKLDSIQVFNQTKETKTVLFWPDTIINEDVISGDKYLFIGYSTKLITGVQEKTRNQDEFQLFPNYPNPMDNYTNITVYVPAKGFVNIAVYNILGEKVSNLTRFTESGYNTFQFTKGVGNVFIATATWENTLKAVTILAAKSASSNDFSISFTGHSTKEYHLKVDSPQQELLIESGILDVADTSRTYVFQFATNISCIAEPVVLYEGVAYNAVQICSQCWLSENLNVGIKVHADVEQTNNGIVEKYCLNNSEDSCIKYGGLYQWGEVMNYSTTEGARGICPPGWHIPADVDWIILEGVADSYFGINDSIWTSDWYSHGVDVAHNLKSTSGWQENGNGIDLFGFGVLAAGLRYSNTVLAAAGTHAGFWTSKDDWDYAFCRRFYYYMKDIMRVPESYNFGFSVRCVKDY